MQISLAGLVRTALITSSLILSSIGSATENGLTLGIHPYQSASKILAAFTPLAEYLSDQAGVPVTIQISPDYETHIQLIGEDRLDIAYLGPASYVELVNKYGLKPILARQSISGNPFFTGVIIVNQSSTLKSLADLEGKRFAFGDPSSTMSHLVPRYMLLQAGIDTESLQAHDFLGSHDNVALAVLSGDYDAGAVKQEVYHKYADRGLKVLSITPTFSEHLFVASNRMDPHNVEKICTAILNLKTAKNGESIMQNMKKTLTDMVPATDADYDNLRHILQELRKTGIIE